MPDRTGRKTGQERVFVERMAATGDAVYAAEKAGYAHPRQRASANLQKPEIVEDVRRLQLARLTNELLPAAVNLLGTVVANEKETTRNRLTAAKMIMDRTLGDKETAEAKPDHELTGAELAASIARGKAALGILMERQSTIEHDAEEADIVRNPSAFD